MLTQIIDSDSLFILNMPYMKFKNVSLICLLTLTSYSSTVDVHFLIGQSNASGRVNTGYTSDPIDSTIDYYYDTDGPAGTAHNSGGLFTTLQPQTNGYYGTEISYGRTVAANTTNDVAIIKISEGGTNLYSDWNNTEDNGANTLWDTFTSESTAAITALQTAHPGCDINLANVSWIQGESDSVNSTRASAYESIFTSFVPAVYAHLDTLGDVSNLQFTTAEVSVINSTTYPFQSTVRDAQGNVMDLSSDYHLVETDDLTSFDGVHYDASSIDTLGIRMANSYLQTVPEPSSSLLVLLGSIAGLSLRKRH